MHKISYSRCRQSLADNTDQIILLTQIDNECLDFSKNSFKNNIRKLVIICNKGQIIYAIRDKLLGYCFKCVFIVISVATVIILCGTLSESIDPSH